MLSLRVCFGSQPNIFFDIELSATNCAGSPSLRGVIVTGMSFSVIFLHKSKTSFTVLPSLVPRLKKSVLLFLAKPYWIALP